MNHTQRYNASLLLGISYSAAVNYARNCGLDLDAATDEVDQIVADGV